MKSDTAQPRSLPPRHSNGALLRRIPLSNLQIVLIALAIVGGRLIFDFSQRIVEGQQKIAEQRELESNISLLTKLQRDLQSDKAYHSSPAYIESWAHDQGKMVRDGEILVIPVYDKYTQAGTALTTAEPVRSLPRWHIWWSLFFDDPIPLSSGADSLTEGAP
jgi:hypothetical protein